MKFSENLNTCSGSLFPWSRFWVLPCWWHEYLISQRKFTDKKYKTLRNVRPDWVSTTRLIHLLELWTRVAIHSVCHPWPIVQFITQYICHLMNAIDHHFTSPLVTQPLVCTIAVCLLTNILVTTFHTHVCVSLVATSAFQLAIWDAHWLIVSPKSGLNPR